MAALVESLVAAGELVCELLASVDPAAPIQGSDWHVRQAAVHLVAGTYMYASCLEGTESPLQEFRSPTLAAFNGGAAMALAGVAGAALPNHLGRAVRHLDHAARDVAPDRPATWHAGLVMPAGFLVRTITMELLLHGDDVAVATGARWQPPEGVAATAVGLFADTAPLQFRKRRATGLDGRYRCDTALGPAWAVGIAGTTIERLDPACKADAVIRGPAMTMLRWTSGRRAWERTALAADGPLADHLPHFMACFSPL